MIIRMYPITPRRGNEPSAQGNALGDRTVALGYLLAGLSGRLSDTCG